MFAPLNPRHHPPRCINGTKHPKPDSLPYFSTYVRRFLGSFISEAKEKSLFHKDFLISPMCDVLEPDALKYTFD